LPNARQIRTAIFIDNDKCRNESSPIYNLFVMQYAQIITHDVAFTVLKESGESVKNKNNLLVNTIKTYKLFTIKVNFQSI